MPTLFLSKLDLRNKSFSWPDDRMIFSSLDSNRDRLMALVSTGARSVFDILDQSLMWKIYFRAANMLDGMWLVSCVASVYGFG